MCLNGEQVHTEDCPTDTCVPGDIKCVNAEGQIITDECTGYFVGCTTEGVYTSPLQVARIALLSVGHSSSWSQVL